MDSPKNKPEESEKRPTSSSAGSLLPSLLMELREVSVALATFGAEQRSLKETVSRLSSMLKDGDGQSSLITRVALLENDMSDLKRASEKTETKIEKLNDTSKMAVYEDKKDVRESKRQKMQVWIAVITAIAAIVVAIVAAMWPHR